MLKGTLVAALSSQPEAESLAVASRTILGAEVMLRAEDLEPRLLGFSQDPDVKRACDQRATFYNEAFDCLFFGHTEGVTPL